MHLLDEIFEDPAAEAARAKNPLDPYLSPRNRYMNKDWKISPDQASFLKAELLLNDTDPNAPGGSTWPADVPLYTLLYKYRRSYMENTPTNMDSFKDHLAYVRTFRRLISHHVVNMGQSKGVVMIFAGYSKNDKSLTKADIISFLENDPLLMKNMIASWEVIDLARGSFDRTGISGKAARY